MPIGGTQSGVPIEAIAFWEPVLLQQQIVLRPRSNLSHASTVQRVNREDDTYGRLQSFPFVCLTSASSFRDLSFGPFP
jgi:hypothetical protein